jgi:large subunit ribosomal protein L4
MSPAPAERRSPAFTPSSAGAFALPEPLFDGTVNEPVLHQTVKAYLNNQRQGTSQVKTRGMVSGGGKKPFRQKGTGRARQGTSRANIHVGGGRAFGPVPRDYRVDIPKKTRRLALRSALSVRAKEGKVIVLSSTGVAEGRTREVAALLKRLGVEASKCLLVLPGNEELIVRAARNLPRLRTSSAGQLNTYEVLHAEHVLVTREALDALKEGRK